MKALKIVNDDLVIENGNFVYVDGIDEIIQSVERNLTTRIEEFFLNTSLGLNQEPITNKGTSDDDIRQALTDAILYDPRVVQIEQLTIKRYNRSIEVNFVERTELGTIESGVTV